jgi:hypothetical protein
VITDYVNSFPVNAVIKLYAPHGRWMQYTTIEFVDRCVSLKGEDIANTFFAVSEKVDGILCMNNTGIQNQFKLSDFSIYAYSSGIPGKSGIKMWKAGLIENVSVSGFSEHGIYVSGSKSGSNNDASFTEVRRCFISYSGSHGLMCDGADCNAGLYHVDTRNNGGYGICDSSFLGNTFLACMAHSNKKGAYSTEGSTPAAQFIGCYAENDQPPSVFNAETKIIGAEKHFSSITGGEIV